MNRLPKVLQLEIWEYVHGDRTFWRQRFRQCMTEIGQPIRNIRHSFGKKNAFFETLDLDSFPLFPPDDINNLTTFMIEQDLRLIRGIQNVAFVNGKLDAYPYHGDVLDGMIFPGHVPDAVYLDLEPVHFDSSLSGTVSNFHGSQTREPFQSGMQFKHFSVN